jgi:hypothetical protein
MKIMRDIFFISFFLAPIILAIAIIEFLDDLNELIEFDIRCDLNNFLKIPKIIDTTFPVNNCASWGCGGWAHHEGVSPLHPICSIPISPVGRE